MRTIAKRGQDVQRRYQPTDYWPPHGEEAGPFLSVNSEVPRMDSGLFKPQREQLHNGPPEASAEEQEDLPTWHWVVCGPTGSS